MAAGHCQSGKRTGATCMEDNVSLAIYSYRETGDVSLLEARISELEAHVEALSRKLSSTKITPRQATQRDLLILIIKSSGGELMEKEARMKLGISKQRMTDLLAATPDIITEVYKLDRRKRILKLR